MTRLARFLPRRAAGTSVLASAVLLAASLQTADAAALAVGTAAWQPPLPGLGLIGPDPDARLHLVQDRYGDSGDDDFPPSDFEGESSGAAEPSGITPGGGVPISGGANITRFVDRAGEACGQVRNEYRVDCLANQFEALARQMPRDGAYADMHDAISKAARDLRGLANANRDAAAPLVPAPNVGAGVDRIARAPLPAVRRDRLEATNRAAEAILEETATLLLRSAENSRNRLVAYQRVAAAIDSSKVLLRST